MREPYTLSGWLRKAQENADGTLTVTGIASDASEPDCDNEVIDIERSWPYFEERMEKMRASSGGRNVLPLRIQHDSKLRRAIARGCGWRAIR
jgi:hypothetical protein